MLSFTLVILLAFIFIAGPYIVPHDPLKVQMDNRLQTSSWQHWLGTDHMGRDLLARTLAGAKLTVGVSAAVLAVSVCIGVPMGLLSGYVGGWLDRLFMRLVDAFLAFPDYIVAIVLSGLLGPGMLNLMIAIITVKWVSYARLVRSTVLTEKSKDYVTMAKISGLSPFKIMMKHMLPHVTGNVLVLSTLDMGKVILMIASLSYIGLGAQPPVPEWGSMLNEGRAFFYHASHLMLVPGLAIAIIVLLTNLLGDSLREHFGVKKQKGGFS
ncbi:nickel transporter permease [Metabacillus lacus]|nr:nickel transporter permease [Metabacillus lacus]